VAARGIDLPNLDLVVHAELPSNHETLLHRSGRTGRAGRKGTSALIVTAKVRSKALRILKGARIEAEWTHAPSADAVRAQDEVRLLGDPIWTDPVTEGEAQMVAMLVDQFTPAQLAAAMLRIHSLRHSAPEDLSAISGDSAPKTRAPFGPSVWFSVSAGRDQGVEVRRLLPILCNAGDITKDDIGAIRIADDISYVELKADSADGFVRALGPAMQIEGGATVARLDHVPDLMRAPKPRASAKPAAKNKWSDKRPAKANGDTKPVDWNDAPAPRARKPKQPDAPKGKPRAPKARSTLEKAIQDGAVTTPKKPRHKAGAKGKPTGGAPKVGKYNSKKNRARRAAAQGGAQPPRRKS